MGRVRHPHYPPGLILLKETLVAGYPIGRPRSTTYSGFAPRNLVIPQGGEPGAKLPIQRQAQGTSRAGDPPDESPRDMSWPPQGGVHQEG